ncbi:hypothetical protein [Hoeflea prorocentri]|uniref:SAM-dependent methyltransferase n=1 Tax=Hoeflea prorocentri TaxID=1922333 RepID=A0A9X3ULV5_9HYPH|nr:hypothetical protein [Hoeflea prorocentri]MCY6381426.1 hypothetical protein [Hoeflea prorocentri]MDA5399226.1 hypothetical protein [Hoeflea prorocentri]
MKSTEGMVDYNRNSRAQQQGVNLEAGRIRDLVERIGRVEPEFRIVDYGCGPGISAINAVLPAVEVYEDQFPDAQIVVCHADQPGNDWDALFELTRAGAGYSYGNPNIRTEASIGSFYDRMASEGSVALGTCFAASHWLSHAVEIHSPGVLWFADLTGDARDEMAEIARQDWARFLQRRAEELRPGGYLLVSTLGSIAQEDEVNGIAASGRGIYRALQMVAQQMADDELINQDVLDNFVFALWFPTAEDAEEPLKNDPVLSAAFELDYLSVGSAPGRAHDVFADFVSDPKDYASHYRGYVHAFAASTLRRQLFEPSVEDIAEVDALDKEFFDRLEALYREETSKYAFELWFMTIVLRRTAQ